MKSTNNETPLAFNLEKLIYRISVRDHERAVGREYSGLMVERAVIGAQMHHVMQLKGIIEKFRRCDTHGSLDCGMITIVIEIREDESEGATEVSIRYNPSRDERVVLATIHMLHIEQALNQLKNCTQ